MRNLRNLFLLSLLTVVIVAGTFQAQAASMSTAGPGNPLDVGTDPITAFVDPATTTYLMSTVAQSIGTIPEGCHTLYFICGSLSANIGPASVTSGVTGGVLVATDSYLKIPLRKDDVTPTLYFIGRWAGSATIRLLFAK